VNQKQGCSIEYVSPENQPTSIMFFHKHVDFVSAACSAGRELLNVTFRVEAGDSFRFVSVLYNVHNPGVFREFKSDVAIDMIFVENPIADCFGLIQIAGSHFIVFQVSIHKDRIVMEKVKGGLSFRNLLSFQLDQSTGTLWVITNSVAGQPTLHELSCSREGIKARNPQHIQIETTSVLPIDLALEVHSQLTLPFYRSSQYRFFVYRYLGLVCFVQQLFEGVDSSCAFSVAIYPIGYSRTVFVPGVGADLPICFLGYDAIVAVFVPNYFLCVVNVSKNPPSISVLPRQFSASVCGRCCANAPIENHVIDLDSADVFNVAFDFSSSALLLPILTKASWEAIAQICAGTGLANHFGYFFHMIHKIGDVTLLTGLLRQLFQYIKRESSNGNGNHRLKHRSSVDTSSTPTFVKLEPLPGGPLKKSRQFPPGTIDHLVQLDEEFPAADGGSRKLIFRGLVDTFLSRRDSRTIDHAVMRAFQELHRQNEIVLTLREAIDFWARTFKPSPLEQLQLGIAIQTETITGNFPGVPCLREEIGLFIAQNSSDTLGRTLAAAKLSRPVLMSVATEGEYRWWRERLPDWNCAGRNDASSSCSSFRLSKSGSLDSRIILNSGFGGPLAWATVEDQRGAML
jgi:hypothetical protein